jgi:hypothetical protein
MTISGIPLHPLVVHAAVFLAPTAAVLAILFAVRPPWRWALRHPLAIAAIGAASSVQFAAITGDELSESLGRNDPGRPLIETHEMWAGRLEVAAWALAVSALVAWWAVPHGSPIPGHEREHPQVAGAVTLSRIAIPLIFLLGVATAVLTVLTGHAGAVAVWSGP